MRRLAPALVLAAALAGLAPPAAAEGAPTLRAGVFDPPRPAPAFTLAGSDGAPLTLDRFRGKVVILAFGFTHCPDVCPTTLGVLARTRKELGAEADGVQVVYVTVDPERDDAARMREYLAKFDPTFLGATGAEEALVAVRKEYGIAAEKTSVGGVAGVAHSSFTYLIDRAGTLRALMPYGHPADDYVHDVRILLKQ
jgi:protein SCO1/2